MLTKLLSVTDSNPIVDQDLFCEHSRITDLYDELVIQQCVDAAHDIVHKWLNRPLYPSVYVGIVDEYKPIIYLPNPTVRRVTSVIAEDVNYSDVTLIEGVDWKFDDINETVRFLTTSTHQLHRLSRFRIQYSCGYDPDCDPVPPAVVSAILMTAATLYENREDTIVGTQINEVPLDAQRLLRIHRRRPM